MKRIIDIEIGDVFIIYGKEVRAIRRNMGRLYYGCHMTFFYQSTPGNSKMLVEVVGKVLSVRKKFYAKSNY